MNGNSNTPAAQCVLLAARLTCSAELLVDSGGPIDVQLAGCD